jgi:hypothetical protein
MVTGADSAKRIAENAMPGWEAIEVRPTEDAVGSVEAAQPDRFGVSLVQLKAKYKLSATDAAGAPDENPAQSDTHLVRLRSKNPADAAVGEKVVVVSSGKVIGVQG